MPMDAVVSDFEAGAAEMLSPDAPADHWDVIEGQGSLFHPAYAAVSLGLLHGSQPDVFVVCHQPGREHILGHPDYPLPISSRHDRSEPAARRAHQPGDPLRRCQPEHVAARSELPPARCWRRSSARLGLPVADPMRGGAEFERLIDSCLA